MSPIIAAMARRIATSSTIGWAPTQAKTSRFEKSNKKDQNFRNLKNDSQGAAALRTIELDQRLGGTPVQVEVLKSLF